MLLDQQYVALGPQGFPEFSLRSANIDRENTNVVFASQLPVRTPCRVSTAALPGRRRRGRGRGRLRRLRSLNADKSAGSVLVLYRWALRLWLPGHRAGLALGTARAGVTFGGARGRLQSGPWSFGTWGAWRVVHLQLGGRDEDVVMAVIAPVEVGTGGSVPNLNRSVVWSVNDNSMSVASCEHVGMLFVAPFAVRTESVAEVVSIRALETAVRVPVVKESREIAKQVTFDTTVVRPSTKVPQAME